jgi:hypothetical protein
MPCARDRDANGASNPAAARKANALRRLAMRASLPKRPDAGPVADCWPDPAMRKAFVDRRPLSRAGLAECDPAGFVTSVSAAGMSYL